MRDESAVLPICDPRRRGVSGRGRGRRRRSIFRGLRGYRTGGTLHIIVNNQVGFTTDPIDARSTHYASDLAKGFEVPIIHVNGDDAESCLHAVRARHRIPREVRQGLSDRLVGYRRHGHNETDEPAFTQPELYKKIRAHPSPREVWGKRLVAEGVVSDEEVKRLDAEVAANFERIQTAMKAGEIHPTRAPRAEGGRGGSVGREPGHGASMPSGCAS